MFDQVPSASPQQVHNIEIEVGTEPMESSPLLMRLSLTPRDNLHTLIEDDGSVSPTSPKGSFFNKNLEIKPINESQDMSSLSPRFLSEFPNGSAEQLNLERERLKRNEMVRMIKDLPLKEQGVGNEMASNIEEQLSPSIESPSGAAPTVLKVGDLVRISESLEGFVRFYGRTQFADGVWVGLALSVPDGMLPFYFFKSLAIKTSIAGVPAVSSDIEIFCSSYLFL